MTHLRYKKVDRIAQGVCERFSQPELVEDKYPNFDIVRGNKGFGSTGISMTEPEIQYQLLAVQADSSKAAKQAISRIMSRGYFGFLNGLGVQGRQLWVLVVALM